MDTLIREDESLIVTGARFHHFSVGKLACTALSDGAILAPKPPLPGTAPQPPKPGAVEYADYVFVPLTCLVVKMPETGQTVLMDSGFGWDPAMLKVPLRSQGRMLQSLEAAGLGPDSIDAVLISHLDPDHVSGLYDEDGTQVFQNAAYYVSAEAVAFWSDHSLDISGSPCPPPIKKQRLQLSAQTLRFGGTALHTFRSGDDVLPGIGTMPLPGHAPGQVGFLLSSEGETLLYGADAIAHAVVSVESPDTHNIMDLDPHLGVETRHKLLQWLEQSGSLFFSPHFPFPSCGHVQKEGGKRVFKPEGKWLPTQARG